MRYVVILKKIYKNNFFVVDTITWSWEIWAKKIRNSFEQKFYVAENCNDKFVNQRCIIKDSYGSTYQFTDFQLRPNFCIALNAV